MNLNRWPQKSTYKKGKPISTRIFRALKIHKRLLNLEQLAIMHRWFGLKVQTIFIVYILQRNRYCDTTRQCKPTGRNTVFAVPQPDIDNGWHWVTYYPLPRVRRQNVKFGVAGVPTYTCTGMSTRYPYTGGRCRRERNLYYPGPFKANGPGIGHFFDSHMQIDRT